MAISIPFVILILGLAVYLLYIKNKTNSKIKNYYLRRFLRNKLQMENYIEELKTIISKNNCGSEFIFENCTLESYLATLEQEYAKNYADFNTKILRRTDLKDKHKKYYAKILIKQSEKLYFIETELYKINQKYLN